MNFFKDKVQKYQEKKLLEAQEKVNFHTQIKNRLEKELKQTQSDKSNDLKKEIEKQKEFIEIWKKNIEKINKQIKKLNKN